MANTGGQAGSASLTSAHPRNGRETQGVSAKGTTYYDGYRHPDIAPQYQQWAENVRNGVEMPFGKRIAGLALYAAQLTTFDELALPDGGERSNSGPGVEWMQSATGIGKGASYCISGALALWALADPEVRQTYPGLFTQGNGNVDAAFANARRLLPQEAVITINPNDPDSLDKLEPGAIVSLMPGLDPAAPLHAPHAFIFQGWADAGKKFMVGTDINAQDWRVPGDKTTAHEGVRTTIRPTRFTYQAILPSRALPDSPLAAANLNVIYKGIWLFNPQSMRSAVTKDSYEIMTDPHPKPKDAHPPIISISTYPPKHRLLTNNRLNLK